MEELVKFTWLTRDVSPYLADRYSERRKAPKNSCGGSTCLMRCEER